MGRSCSCFGFAVFLKERGWWHIRHYWDDGEEGQLGNTCTGRGQPYGDSPSPELVCHHPESLSEIFGCKTEGFVPERRILISDVPVFILSSVQDLYASFWAWTKFHTQARSSCPPTTQAAGALPAGRRAGVVLAQLNGHCAPQSDTRQLASGGGVGWAAFFNYSVHADNYFGFLDNWWWCSLASNTQWRV